MARETNLLLAVEDSSSPLEATWIAQEQAYNFVLYAQLQSLLEARRGSLRGGRIIGSDSSE
jgi:hypothetical protein